MFGKDFREDAASAQNVAAMLQIEDEVYVDLRPRESNGTVELEAHLRGKFVDGFASCSWLRSGDQELATPFRRKAAAP